MDTHAFSILSPPCIQCWKISVILPDFREWKLILSYMLKGEIAIKFLEQSRVLQENPRSSDFSYSNG